MSFLSGVYRRTSLNTSELPQASLNVENKSRSNPLPWRGQFTPEFVQVVLDRYAGRDSAVLDPFVGSGTLLWEAGRRGLAAFGCEINPAAVILARLYTLINLTATQRHSHLDQVSESLEQLFPTRALRDGETGLTESDAVKAGLVDLAVSSRGSAEELLLEALVVLMDFYSEIASVERALATWRKIVALASSLPFSDRPVEVFHTDARRIPLPDKSVDLVFTSPPYINVFNYHQKYRASTEALKWDLLRVARSEFGANRKHRGNRFLTVIQFCLDVAQTFSEVDRVCRRGSRVIFVVGRESRVRGTPFLNGEIVAEVAHRTGGFQLLLRQERVFTNRFGARIYEDILHFAPPPEGVHGRDLQEARMVAREVLSACYNCAPRKARGDIESAVANLQKVMPSPIFQAAKARTGASRRLKDGGGHGRTAQPAR